MNTPEQNNWFHMIQGAEKILIKHLPKSYMKNGAKKFWALRMELFEYINNERNNLIDLLK